MLDLVKNETDRVESRFLEPACGDGNFLIEVLRRKLDVVESRYKKIQLEYERYAVIAVSSLYGVDILEDNVMHCRERLYGYFNERYTQIFKNSCQEECRKSVRFATRVPVFIYLTDYREKSLKDVITQLEPGLFKKVTGLDVKDFELLVSLGVFNSSLMNDAVYKFKRYEDASLEYTGICRHEQETIGLYDTVISADEYRKFN